jgi:hypothetical protein
MMFWNRAKPAPTASEAARTLGAIAKQNAADRRTAMLDTLRGELARGLHANLGWRA